MFERQDIAAAGRWVAAIDRRRPAVSIRETFSKEMTITDRFRKFGICAAVATASLLNACGREQDAPSTTPPPAAEQGAPASKPGAAVSGDPQPARKVADVANDAIISSKVKAALVESAEVKGADVDVDTVKGSVTLKGAVSSHAQSARAVQIAGAVDGVAKVENQLMVKATP